MTSGAPRSGVAPERKPGSGLATLSIKVLSTGSQKCGPLLVFSFGQNLATGLEGRVTTAMLPFGWS